jgi:predicted nucleic acid-binding protein
LIILDTNVISEPMRPQGDPAVQAWLDRQEAETLFVTAISLAELLVGIEPVPRGKRRANLAASLSKLLETLFGPRILPFDQRAAIAYASVIARTRTVGYTISVADAQIAAIASVTGFTVATRDIDPFAAAGTPVVNPWTD